MQLEWLKKEFHLNLRLSPAGVLLAVAYAVAYGLARSASVDQMYLPAGIRVAALLLCPPRCWPYLILGEYAFFAQARYPLVGQYGLAWVVIASAVLMPTVALIVHWHRRRLASHNEAWLLSIAVLSAVAVSCLNQGLAYLLMPTLHEAVSWTSMLRYMVGDYLGILMFAPLALLWQRRHVSFAATSRWGTAAVAALSVIVALGLYAAHLPDTDDMVLAKNSLRIAMMLPAIGLTCLYGWRGAAVSFAAVNLTLALTMEITGRPGSFDATAFMAQQILAVTGTALLLLGSTISHHYHRFAAREKLRGQAETFARTGHLASEQERRQRALQMRLIGEDIDQSFLRAVALLKQRGEHSSALDMLSASQAQSRLFREQISMVYPTEIEYSGLFVALRSGGLAAVWELTDRIASPRLHGDPCRLSLGLQLAAYRSLADAVSLLLDNERGYLQIRVRCGRRAGVPGIMMTVALLDHKRRLGATTVQRAQQTLAGRTLAYGGSAGCRRNRIRLLLVDVPQAYREPSGPSMDQVTPPAVL